MATALIRYEEAIRALAQAASIDEIKEVLAGAAAMAAYARQAKDRRAFEHAAEIQFRAHRELGRRIAAQKGSVGLGKPGPKSGRGDDPISLKEAGVSKHLADRARAAAAVPEDEVENKIAEIREAVADYSNQVTSRIEKGARRAAREQKWGSATLALPDGRYGIILADPEWRFETYGPGGMDRAAENHYRTSRTEVIASRPIADIAADDCILFLWATPPMMIDAWAVMASWGFTYKTHAVWVKDRCGTGYWFRQRHELLLVGTTGKPVPPAPGSQYSSVLEYPVGAHSEKPEAVLKMIERLWPNVPKIELNRRGPARPGWAAWGDEVDAD
jgi:N6-adenosine-specific RNA methylase IME4